MKPLLVDDKKYSSTKSLAEASAELERLLLVSQDDKSVRFLLMGRRLEAVEVRSPLNLKVQPVGSGIADGTLRLLEIPTETAKHTKLIVLQRPNERPFVVALPALAASEKKQSPKFQERVIIGADEAVIVGDDLEKVDKVMFGKQQLRTEKSGNSIKVKGLAGAGATAIAKTQEFTVVSTSGEKTVAQLEVVSSKVETVVK